MSYVRAINQMSAKRKAELEESGRLVPNSTFARPTGKTSKPAPRNTGPDTETLEVLITRCTRIALGNQPCCEGCGEPLYGDRGWDWSVQHRLPRGMGGSRWVGINSPANLLVLCGSATTPGSCHLFAESERTEAEQRGWLVEHGRNPLTVAVLLDGGSRWKYLGEDGEYYDNPPLGVA